MDTQRIKLAALVQNNGQLEGLPRNPREWTAADIERLAASIEETPELLEARPLIAIENGKGKFVVLGGNLRLAALRKLGAADAPVFTLPSDTPIDKLREIVIKDNGSFGSWDYDSLANEWDDLPLTDWGVPAWEGQPAEEEEGQQAQEDDFDESTDEIHVRCKKGDIWQLGEHRLMCGDSISLEDVKKLVGGVQ